MSPSLSLVSLSLSHSLLFFYLSLSISVSLFPCLFIPSLSLFSACLSLCLSLSLSHSALFLSAHGIFPISVGHCLCLSLSLSLSLSHSLSQSLCLCLSLSLSLSPFSFFSLSLLCSEHYFSCVSLFFKTFSLAHTQIEKEKPRERDRGESEREREREGERQREREREKKEREREREREQKKEGERKTGKIALTACLHACAGSNCLQWQLSAHTRYLGLWEDGCGHGEAQAAAAKISQNGRFGHKTVVSCGFGSFRVLSWQACFLKTIFNSKQHFSTCLLKRPFLTVVRACWQITHLIFVRLKRLLYDFFRGCFGPFI